MGTITRNAANNFTTGGVILPAAINDASVASLTELENVATGGAMTLISEQTASSSASVEFTTGIDSTYPIYLFKIVNMHPATDNAIFHFQGNAVGASGFNETITSASFRSGQEEDGSPTYLQYLVNDDQAQGTNYQILANGVGNANDESLSGELYLFNPASTTFVKHFLARFNFSEASAASATFDHYTSGYFNITSAIDEISFKMSSGNVDSGTFKLYGISGS